MVPAAAMSEYVAGSATAGRTLNQSAGLSSCTVGDTPCAAREIASDFWA